MDPDSVHDLSYLSASVTSAQNMSDSVKADATVHSNAVGSSDRPGHGPPDSADNSATKHRRQMSGETATKVTTNAQSSPNGAAPSSAPKARLPHDIVGIYEDRIKEDPRGDSDAWLSLIAEHRKRNKIDEARKVYNRFFKVFPMAAEQLVAYAEMELEHENFYEAEQIFNQFLKSVPSVSLWKVYLDYVRRRNNLTTDTSGQARAVVSQSYDFVLDNIGNDPESGQIWQEYIGFVVAAPGTAGGTAWQDQQKMDQLRKAYQRAVCVPNQFTTTAWRAYNTFEMGLNKQTGRKFLQEKSSSYVSAQAAYKAWQNITRGLQRNTVAKLPPMDGFDGSSEYIAQVNLWKTWIAWEKEDQLALKDEDPKAFSNRILYVYKQALMALRFWPEMWFDAAEFCVQSGLDSEGDSFIIQGIAANPESSILAFARADRLEATVSIEEGDEGVKRAGVLVREPYERNLDALYELIVKNKAKETQDLARIEQSYEGLAPIKDEDEDDDTIEEDKQRHQQKFQQTEGVKHFSASQERLISQCISHVWIALMRAMRRVEGRGNPQVGGSRKVFTDARKRGKILPDVYAAAATMEHYCYRDPVAKGIFDRGAKLFPEDADFALKYLKHLIYTNDPTNARAFFETAVGRLVSKPENIPKAKPLFQFFHEYESNYGELSQLRNLEKRMKEIFPAESQLERFAHRFETPSFDPTNVRLVVSPNTQLKPRASLKAETLSTATPPVKSPKRPLAVEDSETESRPTKVMRGESPAIKGAAGRKLHQQKQSTSQDIRGGYTAPVPVPPEPLPRDLSFVLSIIPRADLYQSTRFKPEKLVGLLQRTAIPQTVSRTATRTLPVAPPPAVASHQREPVGMSYLPPGAPQPRSYY